MVREEGAPGLRRGWTRLRDGPGDGALGHINPELAELPIDSGRPPQRIGCGHFRTRATISAWTGGRPALGRAESLVQCSRKRRRLPTQDRLGSHEQEGLPPPGPDPGQPNPEQAACRTQPGPAERALVHCDLMTQGEVLEGKMAVPAAEDGEEPKQMKQEGDH